MADGEWPRTIPCEDANDRQRAIRVYISDDVNKPPRVAVSAPPGEVGLLSPRGVNELKQALTDAQVEVIHRGRLG